MTRTYARDEIGWRRVEAALPPQVRPSVAAREEYIRVDGLDVHLDRHGREADRTRVVLLHGGGGHGRLLAPIGARLGVAVVAPDLPGYGLTTIAPNAMRYERWVEVAAAVIENEAARADRLVVAGFSMGGLLALHATSIVGPEAVDSVLASTLLDPADPVSRRALARVPLPPPAWLAPLDRLRPRVRWIAPLSKIANDRALARAIAADPASAGRAVPFGFWRSWMQYTTNPPEAFDRAPLTLAHPAADRWTPVELSRRTLARITKVPTREVLLPEGGHLPIEPRAVAALTATADALLA